MHLLHRVVAISSITRHSWRHRVKRFALIFGIGLAASLAGCSVSSIPTLTVTTCTQSALMTAMRMAPSGAIIRFGCSGTIIVTSTIFIDKDVTFDGDGQHVILDGNNTVRVLAIWSFASFTLKHLTIAHGQVRGESGGGLFNEDGTVSLVDCIFADNQAQGDTGGPGDGGAIGNDTDGKMTLDGCTLIGNTARGGGGSSSSSASIPGGKGGDADGGAIVNGGTLVIERSTFTRNHAIAGAGGNGLGAGVQAGAGGDAKGGAIFNGFSSPIAPLTLLTLHLCCTFLLNISVGGASGLSDSASASASGGIGLGGALFNEGRASVTGSGCDFSTNSAYGGNGGSGAGDGGAGSPGQGGAIDNTAGLAVTDCTFEKNVAQGGAGRDVTTLNNGGPGGDGAGGAIITRSQVYHFLPNASLNLTGDTFTANTAQGGEGGGAFPTTPSHHPGGGGQGGKGAGGAIAIISSSQDTLDSLVVEMSTCHCSFDSNHAIGGVGGGGTLFGTYGGKGGSATGGAIDNMQGSLVMMGCQCLFTGNRADGGNGGAGGTGSDIYSDSGATGTVHGIYGGPGGIAIGGAINTTGTATLTMEDCQCTFLSNSADGGNGGMGGEGSGSLGGFGGGSFGSGLSTMGTGRLVLSNCVFAQQVGLGGNGGDAGAGPSESVNTGGIGGGVFASALYTENSNATVTNCTFTTNSGHNGGGGAPGPGTAGVMGATPVIAVGGVGSEDGMTTLINTTFSGNTAPTLFNYATGTSTHGTLTVLNSIIVGSAGGENCATYPLNPNPISDGGYNLEDGASCGFSGTSLSRTNPQLGPLAANGGSTQTMALLNASPAIDAIPSGQNGCGTTITTDQRGVKRPVRNGCDIGAFELD